MRTGGDRSSRGAECLAVVCCLALAAGVAVWRRVDPARTLSAEPDPIVGRVMFVGGSLAAVAVFFWLHAWTVVVLDELGMIDGHRLQPKARPDPELCAETMRHLLFSHVVLLPPSLWLIHKYFAGDMRHGLASELLPCAKDVAFSMIVWHLVFDTWFYWWHRAFHTKLLYKHFHKQHHRHTTPIGIAALYAHPLEETLVNFGSTAIGPMLFPPSHLLVWLLWFALRLHETVDAHCGFDLPYSPWRYLPGHGGAGRHDWHHSHQVGCYGGFRFWDWVCGTDVAWKKWEARQQAKLAAPEADD